MGGDARAITTIEELIASGAIIAHKDGNYGSKYPRAEEFGSEGVPFLTAKSLCDGFLDIAGAPRLGDSRADELTFGFVQPDDVLLSHNATIGRVAVVPQYEGRLLVGTSLTYFRLRAQKLLPRYMAVYLAGVDFQNQLAAVMSHSTRNQIPVTAQRKLSLAVPPLPEQHVIAHILGTLDDKIELNRRRNQTLEAMARAPCSRTGSSISAPSAPVGATRRVAPTGADLWQLFPERLDDEGTPEGWKMVPASELIEFNPTELLRKGTPAPYLDMASLPTSGSWPEPPILRDFGSGMRFRNGDNLLARIAPCLENGKTAFVQCLLDDTVGWGATEYIVMGAKVPIPAGYGYLLARDDTFREHAIRSMTGTSGRQRAQDNSVAAFKLAAPLDEAIWHAFGKQINPFFDSIRSNARASESLAQLRDTLLPKHISGELRVADTEKLVEHVNP